jgi:mevalonate kinase
MNITATAPAKVILFGEHAVNRGQAALAVSVGLYTTCRIAIEGDGYVLASDSWMSSATRREILELGQSLDCYRDAQDVETIQRIAAGDYFAPAKYVLAALGDDLPERLSVTFSSNIPQSAGLGSGAAAFVALAAGLAGLLDLPTEQQWIGHWARRGDIVAHGGVASGLDTQTALLGGAIRYTTEREGEPITYADGMTLVIGNTGVFAATSRVNGRVRDWLAERPTRLHYFQEIGLLSRLAEARLRNGDWPGLGRLMNLNQLLLERIGVSCPELEALIDAALAAGAFGAKLSGSGGGGIMIALAALETAATVAKTISAAGGTPIIAPVGVPGVEVKREA